MREKTVDAPYKLVTEADIMRVLEKFHPVIRDINKWFEFLFDRGYTIKYANFKQNRMVFWNVFLESTDCIIHIFQDHSQIFVSYAPLFYSVEEKSKFYLRNEFALQIMVFYVSNGKNFIGSFEKEIYRSRKAQFKLLASLVEEYHDRITECFKNSEFLLKKGEIEKAAREVNRIQVDKYVLGKQTSL